MLTRFHIVLLFKEFAGFFLPSIESFLPIYLLFYRLKLTLKKKLSTTSTQCCTTSISMFTISYLPYILYSKISLFLFVFLSSYFKKMKLETPEALFGYGRPPGAENVKVNVQTAGNIRHDDVLESAGHDCILY